LLLPTPILSNPFTIYGPTTGIFPKKPAMVARKSPKSIKIPYNSTRKPRKVQRQRIMRRPTKKAAVPFSFCLRAKKSSVLEGPIIMVRPRRKRICGVLEAE